MNGYSMSDDHQPLTYWGNVPLYAAHMLVVVFVASMIVTAILMFSGNAGVFVSWLSFDSVRVMKGEIWRLATYGLVNQPTLWFAIDMVMIIWFGRELEKFFGRRKFLSLYAGFYFLPPVVLTLAGLWMPTGLQGQTGGFGLFIAFATLYPNTPMLFNLLAKWVAMALVGLYVLIALSARDWISMLRLITTTGFAYAFVRHAQGQWELPSLRPAPTKPKLRVLPDLKTERGERTVPRRDTTSNMAEVDALLDKIAKSGISSLTAQERAVLDSAQQTLKQRRSGRP
ncbi:MAG TPA: rhomboid family intramembrane serine protease [Opitutaceae bacterium]|nr:rhomboid family intramembrane serine protease [Opitutaceae bacterium]